MNKHVNKKGIHFGLTHTMIEQTKIVADKGKGKSKPAYVVMENGEIRRMWAKTGVKRLKHGKN